MPDTVIHYFSFVISNFQENLVLSVSALLQQYGGELNEGSDDHICGGDRMVVKGYRIPLRPVQY